MKKIEAKRRSPCLRLGRRLGGRIIYINVLFFNLIFMSYSQQPQLEWVQRENVGIDFACMALDSAGNIITIAYKLGNTVITKYNPSGTIIWQIFPLSTSLSPNDLAVDPYNHIYVAGAGLYTGIVTLVKLDTNGTILWTKYFSDYSTYPYIGLKIDNQGNAYEMATLNNTGITVRKYDTAGNALWTTSYQYGEAYSLAIDNQGDAFTTGLRIIGNESYIETIKFNNAVIWVKLYDYSIQWGGGVGYKIKTDNVNNIYITGTIYTGNDLQGFLTIKYNQNGDSLWTRIYEDGDSLVNAAGQDIEIDNLFNVYISGWDYCSVGHFIYPRITILKYNSIGSLLWKIIDTNAEASGVSVALKSFLYQNNSLFITCTAGLRIYSAKYDLNGNKIWGIYYPIIPNQYITGDGYNIICSSDNSVYVIGDRLLSNSDTIVLLKYSQLGEVKKIYDIIPNQFCLYQNFPNPFNPSTKIKFDIKTNSKVQIKIYNYLGKFIRKLVDEELNPGQYVSEFSGNNLSSGLYFYQLIINGIIISSKKMVLLK